MLLNPWQETGNTGVLSKVKVREVGRAPRVDSRSVWQNGCNRSSRSSSVRDGILLQRAWTSSRLFFAFVLFL